MDYYAGDIARSFRDRLMARSRSSNPEEHKRDHRSDRFQIEQALQPILERFREYDLLRRKLEFQGGDISDLKDISEKLAVPCVIHGRYRDYSVSLMDQSGLRQAIYDLGDYNLRLEVRQGENRMPLYYVCRIKRDYWSEYSLVVEDMYRSPGYPMIDRRFVKITQNGHEVSYLRLSQLREGVSELLADALPTDAGKLTGKDLDRVLFKAGRHVLQAAWHEDQRLATMTAFHFRMREFRNAIELLYLCLSGDLCELRSVVDTSLLRFFGQVYPQSAIATFLKGLVELQGARLNELPEQALRLYYQLCSSFSRFLEIRVRWGHRRTNVPLYKVLYANYSRFAAVVPLLLSQEPVASGTKALEDEARAVIGECSDRQ